MKVNLTIFLFLVFTGSYGQKRHCDWFDMNLKGKPSYVKEISIYSLSDITSPEYENLNSTLNNLLAINEYYFDSIGCIEREIHKSYTDYFDSETDTLYKTETVCYKDSIVTKKYFSGKQLVSNEVKIFDKTGYLERINLEGFMDGFIIYERDSNHQIKTIIEDLTGIDTRSKTKNVLFRNSLGDIINKKTELELITASDNSTEIKNTTETYKYIYDSNNNWIVKTTFYNDSLVLITQRLIKK